MSQRRRHTITSLVVAAAVAGIVAASVAWSEGGLVPIGEDQVRRGSSAFAQHCASCHGEDLEGFGPFPSLAGAQFRGHWQGKTIGELYDYVSTEMPLGAGGSLEAGTYADVIAFILQRNRITPGDTELDPQDEDVRELVLDFGE